MLGIQPTVPERRAMDYLEKNTNQVFLVDFGYGNAPEKAREHWRSKRRKRAADVNYRKRPTR